MIDHNYRVQEEEREYTDPYSMFVYAIRSPYTKESYFKRLRRFFDIIDFRNGETMDKRCNIFAYRGRTELESGRRRHEFQTDHGFRKLYKTQCEIAGMKPINIEKLMGHSVGISDSYYRATEKELLEDYLKAVPILTIGSEYKLQKQMEKIAEEAKDNADNIKSQLYEKEQTITHLTEESSSNTDAIAALSDKLQELLAEFERLKKQS